jgi:hypothetical protein
MKASYVAKAEGLAFYFLLERPSVEGNSSRGQLPYNKAADGAKGHIRNPFTTDEVPRCRFRVE